MVVINNLSKSFGEQQLFKNITFNINHGEKIGLVGRNGAGKSTLLKIIAGVEYPDDGVVLIPKNYKVGYLEQHIHFTKKSIIEEVCSVIQNDNEKYLAKKILFGLGFKEQDLEKDPIIFSGGYQIRINLAKLLLQNPNLLLLDEPGNYLDIVSLRWLINFLQNWKNELILITHDRNFMDSVVTHTIAIHREKIKKVEGDTEKIYNLIAQEEEIYEKTRINDEKKRKEIENYINRFKAKANLASRVKSAEKLLNKQEKKEKLIDIKNLDFRFNYVKFEPKIVMEVNNLSFGYEISKPIIKNFSFVVEKEDKIAIIGKNGKGKTTLLKLLSGKIKPSSGEIKINNNCKIGYFEQTNIMELNPDNTVEEEIDLAIKDRDNYKARNIAGIMLFEGDKAEKKIKVLSGGEKARVMLGKIICNETNLLLLDEPTNHFDIESCDSILQAIIEYPGSILLVTHNEMFLHSVPNKLIIFTNNDIIFFNGTYQDFLDKIGWEDEKENIYSKEEIAKIEQKIEQKENRKENKKNRAILIEKKSKELKPLKEKISKIETEIENMEKELEKTNKDFEEATINNNGKLIKELSIKISELEKKINESYNNYEKILENYDKIEKEYNQKIEELYE